MSSKWWSKSVIVGAVVCGLLLCFFTGFVITAISCPGGLQSCLSGSAFFKDLINFGLPALLIGGSIGAGLGALYAAIRKRLRKK